MLKRLFTPKWQHKDVEVRKAAVEQLNASTDEDALTEVLRTDSNPAIRQIALTKIDRIELLTELLKSEPTTAFWSQIAARYLALFPENTATIAHSWRSRSDWNPSDRFAALNHIQSDTLQRELLSSLNEEEKITFIVASKNLSWQSFVLNTIHSVESLTTLQKRVTQKSLLQDIRQKLKQAKEEEKQNQATITKAKNIIESLSKMAQQDWDEQRPVKFNLLVNQWNALPQTIVQPLVNDFQEKHDEVKKQLSAIIEKQEQERKTKAAISKQKELCEQLASLITELKNESLDSVQALKDAQQIVIKNWQQLSEDFEPSAKMKGRFEGLMENLAIVFGAWDESANIEKELQSLVDNRPFNEHNSAEPSLNNPTSDESSESQNHVQSINQLSLLNGWLKQWDERVNQLNWPKGYKLPKSFAHYETAYLSIKSRQQSIIAEQEKRSKQFHRKLNQLRQHIQKKNLIAANRLLNHVNHQLDELEPSYQNDIRKRLRSFDEPLQELKDWHEFATLPKKQSLCESMKQLATGPKSPLEQAKAIRELQDQWQQLAASDSEADQAFWDEFKASSDKAFEVCHQYYLEQDRVKAEHLRTQLSLIEQLETLSATACENNEDWKKLDKTLRAIDQKAKSAQPVPPNESKRVRKQYDLASKPIREALKQYKQDNKESREELIARAQKLLSLDDTLTAIERAKQLQNEWKSLGPTFHKENDRLWKAFRKTMDQVFQKREEEKASFKADLNSNAELLITLTKEINLLSQLDDEALKKSEAQFNALTQQWSKNNELPRAKAKKLLSDYHRACDHYHSQFSGIEKRQQHAFIETIYSIAQQLVMLEDQKLHNKTVELTAIKSAIESLPNSDLQEAIVKRLSNLEDDALELSQEANQKAALEDLVLDGEILWEVDSPEAFKSQRMEKQLKILQNQLGVANDLIEKHRHWQQLQHQWLLIGNVRGSERVELDKRWYQLVERSKH